MATYDLSIRHLIESVENLTLIVKGFEAEMLNLRDETLKRWDAEDIAAFKAARESSSFRKGRPA